MKKFWTASSREFKIRHVAPRVRGRFQIVLIDEEDAVVKVVPLNGADTRHRPVSAQDMERLLDEHGLRLSEGELKAMADSARTAMEMRRVKLSDLRIKSPRTAIVRPAI
ncbi:hypothetical protein FVE85_7104 [Porphyridium purpureum]|uniref:Uncharacterized protein n=1 Tax=Porphyridium purpureum TaxID=35688 RepID=A0A5J4Z644_PORPP|nr:hypothetical protein FVE85_7104 [Porphyridium purpureum]|eukprot:POR3292..scf295_1